MVSVSVGFRVKHSIISHRNEEDVPHFIVRELNRGCLSPRATVVVGAVEAALTEYHECHGSHKHCLHSWRLEVEEQHSLTVGFW